MTFVYCIVARLLYTRGQSPVRGALRKQSVQPGYSLDEKTHGRGWNTNRNWNSTNTGVPSTPNGLHFAPRNGARSCSRVYTMYGIALSYSFTTTPPSEARVHSARRGCAYYQVYRASPIETKARSTTDASHSHCRLRASDTLHPILQSISLSRHLIASLRRFRIYRRDETFRTRGTSANPSKIKYD